MMCSVSGRSIKLPTQGVAFVHNLFCGAITAVGRGVKNGTVKYDFTRYTPIHRPYSTDITGFMSVLHGDVRFYNSVFVQQTVRQGMLDICEEDHDGEKIIFDTDLFGNHRGGAPVPGPVEK